MPFSSWDCLRVLAVVLLLSSGFFAIESLAAGDPERGKTLYAVCSTCHGDQGQGMPDMNGPALAGRESWYLKRQIQNFKSGARGSDSRDIYGLQMAPMAQMLADDQAIDDVLAYLASLE